MEPLVVHVIVLVLMTVALVYTFIHVRRRSVSRDHTARRVRSTWSPQARRRFGIYILLGISAAVALAIVNLLPILGRGGGVIVIILALVGLFILAPILLRKAGREAQVAGAANQPSAEQAIGQDGRPPVIYLRSFVEDGRRDGTPVLDHWLPMSQNEEEKLIKPFGYFGPVVAIGRPGEDLPERGAYRDYVADDEWQSKVIAWMERSRIIILVAGGSQGVVWERDMAFRKFGDRSILVFFPATLPENERSRYCVDLRGLAEVLGRPFPDLSDEIPDLLVFPAERPPVAVTRPVTARPPSVASLATKGADEIRGPSSPALNSRF